VRSDNFKLLQFGIPTIDWLFGKPIQASAQSEDKIPFFASIHESTEYGIRIEPNHTTSLCIIGPDGTGKSLLALHLAARYAFRSAELNLMPRILYASTDLSYGKADEHWQTFGLHYNPHCVPFRQVQEEKSKFGPINLNPYGPVDGKAEEPPLAEYLLSNPKDGPVTAFLNLESATAGDDWGFLNRVLALLPPIDFQSGEVPHLLVIDAVEGLETMVGDVDAYGQKRARRSRIAQIIRSASGKCHLLFVCEESTSERLPEEFVTDVVVRLHDRTDFDYHRRTIEITKARGQWHVRGDHPYVIRKGGGSSTVTYSHSDEPLLKNSYILAFPSLSARYREVMVRSPLRFQTESQIADRAPEIEERPFGIQQLNDILENGLPKGGVTALIGEEGTYKSRLGRNFLSRCYVGNSGVGILISNQDHIRPLIERRIASHLAPDGEIDQKLSEQIVNGLIYRRLETHHMTSPILFHIIEQAIEDARSKLKKLFASEDERKDERKVWEESSRIRLVIDDWTQINRAHPELQRDPLFLPFLLFFLRRKNITTLIIDTHPGDPETVKGIERDRDLPSQVERRLYAWRLPFFGEDRVAIRAVPPLSPLRPAPVRELLPEMRQHDERLEAQPEFELYDFSVSPLRPVPLDVRLYVEESDEKFDLWRPTQVLFQELFRIHALPGKQVLCFTSSAQYEAFRDFCHLQGNARLDHTLVLQVDEFWSRAKSPTFVPLNSYLTRSLTGKAGRFGDDPGEDPYESFRNLSQRSQGFVTEGYDFASEFEQPPEVPSCVTFSPTAAGDGKSGDVEGVRDDSPVVDRIPYMWDFGFLLCDQDAWEKAINERIPFYDGSETSVGKIWNVLTGSKPADVVSWRKFLGACTVVANKTKKPRGKRSELEPFDVDLHATSESMSCLVLEVWLSEIANRTDSAEFLATVSTRYTGGNPSPSIGLRELLENYQPELFRTWLLLGDFLSQSRFPSENLRFVMPPKPRVGAVATRHWYSTASIANREAEKRLSTGAPNEASLLFPVRLPGRFSVRGDWDLAIAKGSLSTRLGERVLDLLSSRRSHIERLRSGIGLPTRYFTTKGQLDYSWTNLWRKGPSGQPKRLSYERLKQLGGQAPFRVEDKRLSWLWRSRIKDYDRTSRFWVIWLCSIRESWEGIRQAAFPGSINGLAAYDASFESLGDSVGGYAKFQKACKYLCDTLGHCQLQQSLSDRSQ